MKRLLALVLSVLIVLPLCGCGILKPNADGASVVLKVGTTTAPEGHYVKGLEEFSRLLTEYSDGEIKLEIYPNSQLGNERDLVEGVGLGTIPMALISTGPLPNFIPDFAIFDLPYLFPDSQSAYDTFDGPIGQSILAQLEPKKIKGLGYWENGFRHLTNDTKEITVPGDLKGMTIRTMENDIHMDTYRQYGANPTPMAWGEIFTALQQGAVDGQENPLAIIESAKVYEVQQYITLIGNFYSPCVLIINGELFDDLTPEFQEIISRAADEAKVWQRQYSQDYNEEAIQLLKDAGCTVTEVDQKIWREASMATYDHFKDQLNQDYITEILAAQN